MVPVIVVVIIIVLIGAFVGIAMMKNVRSTYNYSVGEHNIEVVTANLSITLLVDGEEEDKVTYYDNK